MGILNASQSSAKNTASGSSSSWSNTAGAAASAASAAAAQKANELQYQMFKEQMEYNRQEAQKNRDWQEQMSNTTYQRTVKDMVSAGINPILAAQLGISADSVGSGSTASVSSPSALMAQTFAEQNSASTASNSAEGWSNSTSGLSTFLEQMSGLIGGLIGATNSAQAIDISLNGLDSLLGTKSNTTSLFEKHTENSKKNSKTRSVAGGMFSIRENSIADTISKYFSKLKTSK